MSKKKKPAKKAAAGSSISTEVRGILLLSCAPILLLSLFTFVDGNASANWLGLLGYSLGWLCQYLFGFGSYLLVGYLGFVGWQQATQLQQQTRWRQHVHMALGLAGFCFILTLIAQHASDTIGAHFGSKVYSQLVARNEVRYYLGGFPAYTLYLLVLRPLLSDPGLLIASIIALSFGVMGLFGLKVQDLWTRQRKVTEELDNPEPPSKEVIAQEEKSKLKAMLWRNPVEPELKIRTLAQASSATPPPPEEKAPSKKVDPVASEEEDEEEGTPQARQQKPPPSFENYKIPSANVLTAARVSDQSALKKDLKQQAQILEETLTSFGIEAKVGQINCGPTITSFEVHPNVGVKVQKITALEHDIALNLRARSIRIIAPIPGKAAVGIEVPNPHPQEVGFRELLSAYQKSGRRFHIPILLGKTVNGDDVMTDLTKMPHLIIAGATGSGKSVCINTIVMSILLNARPDEIRLLMVDPKKVELTGYSKLPHMIAPVITEPSGAYMALNWLVKEMETRYEILKAVGVRNISSFNTRKRDIAFEQSLSIDVPERMPYYVGIIDELADLMMVSNTDIETPIARIAQMARAVGIHLILATQRPSREVITGLIKANFPTRIAFKVSSRVNSQIILDEPGAETLLGNGDMLFLPPGSSNLIRAQGAFIRDEDINEIVERICKQCPTQYLIKSFENIAIDVEENKGGGSQERDPLYDQALQTIVQTGNASTTFLQRKLKIGYARAASIMDQLETHGVVGPIDGAKARQILVTSAADPNA